MFRIEENGLTEELFIKVRELVGFPHYEAEDIKAALAMTAYSVVVWDNEIPVGIGRVISDGRIAFFVKDIAVVPDYQGKGVGQFIMNAIMDYIKANGCKNAYVALMATHNNEGFYKKFGFIQRPTEALGSGMVQYVNSI